MISLEAMARARPVIALGRTLVTRCGFDNLRATKLNRIDYPFVDP
jgi:hypothetical protein